MHFIFSESVPCEAGCESAISPTIYVVKHFSKLKLKISEQSVDVCEVRKKKLPATTIMSMTLTKT